MHDQQLISIVDKQWQCNLQLIAETEISDDITNELAKKISKLDDETYDVLNIITCCGITSDCCTQDFIKNVLNYSSRSIEQALTKLINSSLVYNNTNHFSCAHDRIQETVLANIQENRYHQNHLLIARYFASLATTADNNLAMIHYIKCQPAIKTSNEQLLVANLSLKVAIASKASASYETTKQYLATGIACLSKNAWQDNYRINYNLLSELAEIEYIQGNHTTAIDIINDIILNTKDNYDLAYIYRLLIVVNTMQGKYQEAIDAGRIALKLLSIDLPTENLPTAVEQELLTAQDSLGAREILDLANAAEMQDKTQRLQMQLLLDIDPPAYILGSELYPIIVAKMAALSMQNGAHPASAKGFVTYGLIIGDIKGDYQLGNQFARTGLLLADRFEIKSEICKAYTTYANWVSHRTESIQLAEKQNNIGFNAGMSSGEQQFASYAKMCQLLNDFYLRTDTTQLLKDIPNAIQFSKAVNSQLALDTIQGLGLIVSTLKASFTNEITMHCQTTTEQQYLTNEEDPNRNFPLAIYFTLKAQLLYMFGEYSDALTALEIADREKHIMQTLRGLFHTTEYIYYHSLVLIALLNTPIDNNKQNTYKQQITGNIKELEKYTIHAEENIQHKLHLVKAELARSSNDNWTAQSHFNQAISLAKTHGFKLDAAIATERYALFLTAHEMNETAQQCYKEAKRLYQSTAITSKIDHLQLVAPTTESPTTSEPTSRTSSASSKHHHNTFEVETITKAVHTFASKKDPNELLSAAMERILVYAGAKRGVLLLAQKGKLQLRAIRENEAMVFFDPKNHMPTLQLYSHQIVKETQHKQRTIIIHDARKNHRYYQDNYHKIHKSLSILSMPIINQGQLLGVIYLENNNTPNVFSDTLIGTLTLISSQLAVSLETTARYQELRKIHDELAINEKRFHSLCDAASVGIAYIGADISIQYMNKRYQEITGLNLATWAKHRFDIVAPSHKAVINAATEQLMQNHGEYSAEIQLRLLNGVHRWITLNSIPITDNDNNVINYIEIVTDITEQKLIHSTIPNQVVKMILKKPSLKPQQHATLTKNATIMFADIVGFSQASEKIMPLQLLSQLNVLYSAFDTVIKEKGLTRLKIIGDCYMVIGGMLEHHSDHMQKMIELAIAMREIAYSKQLAGEPTRLRIGINSGPIVSGIIGNEDMAFDIYGRAANVAKRLQEHTNPDTIHIYYPNAQQLNLLDNFLISSPKTITLPDHGIQYTCKVTGHRSILRKIINELLRHLHAQFPTFLSNEPAFQQFLKNNNLTEETFLNNNKPINKRKIKNSIYYNAITLYNITMAINPNSNINQKLPNNFTILHLAVLLNCPNVVRWASYLFANIETQHEIFTPLMQACKYNADTELLNILLHQIKNQRQNINTQNKHGWSALQIACIVGNLDHVKLLLAHGANPNLKDKNNLTPIITALIYGHEHIVSFLTNHKDINLPATFPLITFEAILPFKAGINAPQQISAILRKYLMWRLFRKSMVADFPETILPRPFHETLSPPITSKATLQFIFLSTYDTPTLLLTINDESMMIDCGTTAFPSIKKAGINPAQITDYCITNFMGSHAKGLELPAFYNFFAFTPPFRPKIHINSNHLRPLWKHSLAGGLSTLEGINTSLSTFFDIETTEEYDYFMWQDIRFWMLPTSTKQNYKYCAILFTINNRNFIINPDPEFKNQTLIPYYKEADHIFANIAAYPAHPAAELELLSVDNHIKQRTSTYATDPNKSPLESQFFTAITSTRSVKLTEENIPNSSPRRITMRRNSIFSIPKINKKPSKYTLGIIGTSTAFSDNNNNALLVANNHRLLIDCGGTYFNAAITSGYNPLAVEGVYISHLHLDHVGGLVDLITARRSSQEFKAKKLQLFIHKDLLHKQKTRTLWNDVLKAPLALSKDYKTTLDDYFEVHELDTNNGFNWHGIDIELVKTDHVMDHDNIVPTHGLMMTINDERCETHGKKILYTTDTKNIPDLDKYCHPADLIFHDCSLVANPVHTALEELQNLPSEIKKKTWLMHTESNIDKNFSSFKGLLQPTQEFDLTTTVTFTTNNIKSPTRLTHLSSSSF